MIDARTFARKLLLGGAAWSGTSKLAEPFLSGAGGILMLHRISRTDHSPLGINRHLTVDPRFLDRLLADMKRRGMAVVSMDELVDNLASGRARRLFAVTADDGWLDNLTEALPVFEAHDVPFTVYVAPGLVTGAVEPWWEVVEAFVAARNVVRLPAPDGEVELRCPDAASKRAAVTRIFWHLMNEIAEQDQQAFLHEMGTLPAHAARRFMNWDEIRRLATHPLATIGAHTVHHYNLKRLARETALSEMQQSAAIIGHETGTRPRHFAYPYGFAAAAGQREVELASEAGFASAVTTRHGVLRRDHANHLHALPRISVNGNFQRLSYMRPLLSGLMTPLANRGRRFVTV
ncbi:polysaccharide deacetylase family protein [Mesorhizobium sp. CAU 1741]|uniref:polysaccharide deacetylase family protein n=1 Tax=Mesorhizobium sp. CAU 1741 TaxID=3140366 RepID=UPI00325BDF1D